LEKWLLKHYRHSMAISISAVVFNSKDWPKNGVQNFGCPKSTKMYWYVYNNSVPLLNIEKKLNISSSIQFQKILLFCLPASQPAGRPGSTSAMAPVFFHTRKLTMSRLCNLFWRRFIHCAMVFPFICCFFPFFSTPLWKGEKLAKEVMIDCFCTCEHNYETHAYL